LFVQNGFLANYYEQRILTCGALMEWDIDSEDVDAWNGASWSQIEARESHVNHWVRRTQVCFSKNFGKILKEARLIASEWAVLRELYGPGRRSPVDLAQVMGMSKGGMSKLIDRLVNKGYVVKEVQELDRRFRGIWLTKQGRACVPSIAAKEKSADRAFFGPLRGGGRYSLTKSLKQILTVGRRAFMKEWVTLHGALNLPQPDDESGNSDADSRWADAEALDNYCKQVAMAAALGQHWKSAAAERPAFLDDRPAAA
jgi:DNA-binding MarR family transcriptional regulator